MSSQQPRTEESGTQLKILIAAARLFRLHGYDATTLRGIASECGLKAGSIYYHFASKDEILATVLEFGLSELLRRVRAGLDQLPPETTPLERIKNAVRIHLESMLEFGDFTATNVRLFSQAPATVQERGLAARRVYEDYWKQLFTAAQEAGQIREGIDLSIARLFLSGGMSWTLEWYQPGGLNARELADQYTEMLLHGIAT